MKFFIAILIFSCRSFFAGAQEPYPEMVFVKGGKFKMGSSLGVKVEIRPSGMVMSDSGYAGLLNN